MKLAMVGLGKMGANMASRLLRGGHAVVAFDLNANAVRRLEAEGAEGTHTLAEAVAKLSPPRIVWVMLPAGEVTEAVVHELGDLLSADDIIVDGGNTMYKDDIRRAAELAGKGIHYIDVGTSGGVWGLAGGYSMMIGGEAEVVSSLRPIFETLAPAAERGWGHVGPVGAGHFVKMVHNGVEYGMMQAYAEGFEIMHAKKAFALDLHQIAEIWRHGSVVRSWLLDLISAALEEDQELREIAGYVVDSGEGRWALLESIDLDVPAPVLALSLQRRFSSRQKESYGAKLLAALRHQFGGHAVRKAA